MPEQLKKEVLLPKTDVKVKDPETGETKTVEGFQARFEKVMAERRENDKKFQIATTNLAEAFQHFVNKTVEQSSDFDILFSNIKKKDAQIFTIRNAIRSVIDDIGTVSSIDEVGNEIITNMLEELSQYTEFEASRIESLEDMQKQYDEITIKFYEGTEKFSFKTVYKYVKTTIFEKGSAKRFAVKYEGLLKEYANELTSILENTKNAKEELTVVIDNLNNLIANIEAFTKANKAKDKTTKIGKEKISIEELRDRLNKDPIVKKYVSEEEKNRLINYPEEAQDLESSTWEGAFTQAMKKAMKAYAMNIKAQKYTNPFMYLIGTMDAHIESAINFANQATNLTKQQISAEEQESEAMEYSENQVTANKNSKKPVTIKKI